MIFSLIHNTTFELKEGKCMCLYHLYSTSGSRTLKSGHLYRARRRLGTAGKCPVWGLAERQASGDSSQHPWKPCDALEFGSDLLRSSAQPTSSYRLGIRPNPSHVASAAPSEFRRLLCQGRCACGNFAYQFFNHVDIFIRNTDAAI